MTMKRTRGKTVPELALEYGVTPGLVAFALRHSAAGEGGIDAGARFATADAAEGALRALADRDAAARRSALSAACGAVRRAADALADAFDALRERISRTTPTASAGHPKPTQRAPRANSRQP